ncbi:hypothetical protein EMIT0357P_40475 [Pseudomonas marginalis]
MTGTPILVNTAKWPVISRVALIYLACGQFKQTFVLDADSGLYIMRHLERQVGHPLPLRTAMTDTTPNLHPLEKKPVEP